MFKHEGGDTGDSGGGEDGDIEFVHSNGWYEPIFSCKVLLGTKSITFGDRGDRVDDVGDNGDLGESFRGGRYNSGLSDRCFRLPMLPPLPFLL